MLVVRADKARDVLCVAFAAVIALLSIAFAVQYLGAGSLYFDLPMKYSHFLAVVNIVIDITGWPVHRVLLGEVSPRAAARAGNWPNSYHAVV